MNNRTLEKFEKPAERPRHFLSEAIEEDLKNGRFNHVHTRFPPEPNGYLHIGHAMAINVDFGMAEAFDGVCNLRMDDTNPTREETEYVEGFKEDIKWLGFDWEDRFFYASDYFETLFGYANKLIDKGLAYVDDLNADEIREYRGTLTEPGKNSPFRDRSVEENRDLFARMRAGEFPEGSKVVRARIDMAHPNMNMRDPVMYRILFAHHHRTGDKWCIYPTYDFTHGQSDSLEGITHSLCDLGFENHRPLYDWYCEKLEIHHPRQIEFARLNISYMITSKRRLLRLVQEGHVSGWDDPRMPTLRGMRRRGYSASAIRNFLAKVGATKFNSVKDFALLEFCLRDDLNKRAPRVMGVLDPVKLVVTNYPEGLVEEMEAINNPEDPEGGTRKVPFSRELFIERSDFRESANRKYHRLVPGREVRLRYGYVVTCTGCKKDEQTGEILEVHCEYDPETRGGNTPDNRRIKGTIHWVSAAHALKAEVRLYDRLFSVENPVKVEKGGDFIDNINPDSLTIKTAFVEPGLNSAVAGDLVQFERTAYFCVDNDSTAEQLVFNRTVTLRDSWGRK